ncbi:hypothetical protein BGZ99_005961 [Dissophora globulifera]|uniref:Uncharacterized protein n=1 Tax=Dissophora globulifera TaxID=979702 RepID=A0A9P6REL9_9FUNG|nr:hypothetical protein BGZ99_005961 [Dissophora globulifera]
MLSPVFIPTNVFDLNLVLGIFRFLLVQAVGAGLAIYSKIGGDYANNIRWMRQGGYVEMVTSLFATREGLPRNARIALFATIVLSYLASISDKGVSKFIGSTERYIHPESELKVSENYMPFDGMYTLLHWTGTMSFGHNITNNLERIISENFNSPDVDDTDDTDDTDDFDYFDYIDNRQFKVQISDYTAKECLAWDFSFANTQYVYNNSCAVVSSGLNGMNVNYVLANTTTLREGRWSISAPMTLPSPPLPIQLDLRVNATAFQCVIKGAPSMDVETNMTNLKELPRTFTTKCVTKDGDAIVLTYSTTKFVVKQTATYSNETATVFDDKSDELLNAMKTSISNSLTLPSNGTVLMEIKVGNLTADVLYCYSDFISINAWTCSYVNIDTFLLERQELDSEILAKFSGYNNVGTPINIEHVPPTLRTVLGPISLVTLRGANKNASVFMAKLGSNFVTEDTPGQDGVTRLYVLFEITTFTEGFLVDVWVLCVVAILATFAIGLWGSANFFLGRQYNTSFYKSVTQKVTASAKKDASALLKSVAVSIVTTGMGLVLDEDLERPDMTEHDMTGHDMEKAAEI